MLGHARELYEEITNYEGQELFNDVLRPWSEKTSYQEYLLGFYNQPIINIEDNWEFYALSRVLDLLTLPFQPNRRADSVGWLGPVLTLKEYVEFNALIGLTTTFPETYHNFTCEILEAKPGNNDFKITEHLFPASRLENLLIKRSGVLIELSANENNMELVNEATIYWTYWRKNRPYKDLSQGWGSNSQWRTDFRFDSETADAFIYNQQGKYNLNDCNSEVLEELKQQNLSVAEAIELTTNRQFITCSKNDTSLSPYDFSYKLVKPNS